MRGFEEFSSQRNLGDETISNIFPNDGRRAFSERVKKTFDWSKKGGALPGTPLFLRNVVGNVKLKPQEFKIIKQEIKKELDEIKKREEASKREEQELLKEAEKNSPFRELNLKDRDKLMLDGARRNLEEEIKRSSGVDPNEI